MINLPSKLRGFKKSIFSSFNTTKMTRLTIKSMCTCFAYLCRPVYFEQLILIFFFFVAGFGGLPKRKYGKYLTERDRKNILRLLSENLL